MALLVLSATRWTIHLGTPISPILSGKAFIFSEIEVALLQTHASVSIATKNQPFSQGGWGGCDSLIASCLRFD